VIADFVLIRENDAYCNRYRLHETVEKYLASQDKKPCWPQANMRGSGSVRFDSDATAGEEARQE
jgi:hypothetical protein